MMRKIRHWFVAHAHNDHRPYLVRPRGLAMVLLGFVLIQAAAYGVRPAGARAMPLAGQVLGYGTDISTSRLLELTNTERAKAGFPPLTERAQLDISAKDKAEDMFKADYWAHDSPTGVKPWFWFDRVGYAYDLAGENLAKDFDTSSGVTAGWMNSPGHKANVMNPGYEDVGFAVVNGSLQGRPTTLVVAHYGRLKQAAAAAAAPAVTPTGPVAAGIGTSTGNPASTPVPSAAQLTVAAGPERLTVAPPASNYGLFAPLTLTDTLGWPALASLSLLLVLLGVYLGMHIKVWWLALPRLAHRHYRATAALQVGVVVVLIMAVATSGLGRVG